MKNTIAILTIILAAQISIAHGLTQGQYEGSGLWKGLNHTGNYQANMVVEKNAFKAEYNLGNGSKKDWTFTTKETVQGFFDVLVKGKKIGTGYCLDKVNVCHYQINVNQLKLEETIVQDGSKIYRFGSKNEKNGLIAWQESYKLVEQK